MSEQGYITIATGDVKYVNMAYYLALSVKINDPKRPITLLTDKDTVLSDKVKKVFDQVIMMPKKSNYIGCMNKLRMYKFSPYKETMYVDSDCLIVKKDMDRHWEKFSGSDVNLAGGIKTSGPWYQTSVEKVQQVLNCEYLVHMNSGVIYFKASTKAQEFFEYCELLLAEHRELLSYSHKIKEQVADEPFIGAALGVKNIKPIQYTPEEGSIMITTFYAKTEKCDPINNICTIYKATKFYILNRFWAASWVKHTPSIAHFVNAKPKKLYKEACDMLENVS